MGYVSDIRIRILKDDYLELEKQYLSKFANDSCFIDFWNKKDIYKEENGTVYFGWNSAKWYISLFENSFAHFHLIKDFILGLSTYSYGIIGEEIDDIDFDWNGEIEPIEIVRGFVE